MKNQLKGIKTQIGIISIFLMVRGNFLMAQIPRDIPTDSNPLNIETPWKIFWYIVVPVVIVLIAYILVQRSRKKKEEDSKKREEM